MRRAVRRTIAASAIGYAGILGYMSLNERSFVFHPADRAVETPRADLALHEQRLTIPSVGGSHLGAWIIPAKSADTAAMWMLICHGNYGNIGYGGRPPFYASMRDLGINLLAFDYRGFGESDGDASEQNVYADARAAYDWLRNERHVPADRIIIFGHSLGSGVATELASHVPAAGLVLEGAFTSVPNRGQEIYPFLPIKLIARTRFASIEKIAGVHMPKLFLHSPEDRIIPIAHGRALFAAASEPKRFVEVKGGHDDAYRVDHDVYYGAIREFLATLHE